MNHITEDCHFISNHDNLHVLDKIITSNKPAIIAVPNINQAIRLKNQHRTINILAYPREDVDKTRSNITVFTYKSLLEYILHSNSTNSRLSRYSIDLSKIVFANCSEITDPIYNREWELIIMLLPSSQFFFLHFCADDACVTRFIRWLYVLFPKKRIIKDIHQHTGQIHMKYINDTIDIFKNRFENKPIQKIQLEPLVRSLELHHLFPVALINFSQKTVKEVACTLVHTCVRTSTATVLLDIDRWIAKNIHPSVQTLHEFTEMRQMLAVGIAYYHGALLQPIRELVEYCATMKYIRILSCTDAFPTNQSDKIKTVVFMDYKRFGGQSFVNVSPMIFKKQIMHATHVVQCIDNVHRIRTCHKLKNTTNKFIKNNTLFTSINILSLLSRMDMPALFQLIFYKSFMVMDKKYIDNTLNHMLLSGTLCNTNSPEMNHIIYKITPYGLLVSQFTCFANPMEHFDCRTVEPSMVHFIQNTAVILMKEYNTRATLIPAILDIIRDLFESKVKLPLLCIEQICESRLVRLATLHSLFVRICYVSDFIRETHKNSEIPPFYDDLMHYLSTNHIDIHALV